LAYAFIKTGTTAPVLIASKSDGTCAKRLTAPSVYSAGPSFFPGGRSIAFSSTSAGQYSLFVLDLETLTLSRVEATYAGSGVAPPNPPLITSSPAVAPDGQSVTFSGGLAAYPGWSDIFVVPKAGGGAIELGGDNFGANYPTWSPDGSTIYFTSRRVNAGEIYSVPAAGGVAATRVTTDSRISSAFTISGDGRELVYARFSTTGTGVKPTELVAQDLTSGAIRVISSNNEADPAVDATNSTVAVSRRSATGYDLYLLDYATGATIRQLTNCPGQAFGATFAR
jgi:Tol biopolymer transport system component